MKTSFHFNAKDGITQQTAGIGGRTHQITVDGWETE
jgi:hypothetical protein